MDAAEVYYYDGQKIIETRDGSGNMVRQFIHGTQYIDELVMMRAADKGDLYVHQDANWNVIALTDLGGSVVEHYVYTPYGEVTVHQETSYGDRDGDQDVDSTDKGTPGSTCTGTVSGSCRILDLDFDGGKRSERKRAAIGKASREARVRPATCPKGTSTKRASAGLDVDSTDKGTPGSTCTGTVSGSCRILDLDFDGGKRSERKRAATGKANMDVRVRPATCPEGVGTMSATEGYDSADATKFDALAQGHARHPGRSYTGVDQPMGHQGFVYEPEIQQFQGRARQLDPAKRRFLQSDPAGFASAMNLYVFVRSDPLNSRDPFGSVVDNIIEFADRVEVQVSLAFFGERIKPDSLNELWYQRELGEFGVWNIPGNEKGQGVFGRFGCSGPMQCASVCKKVKVSFDSEVYPFHGPACTDEPYGGSCKSDARSYTGHSVSVHVRGPSEGADIRSGTPGFSGDGGGAAGPIGGDQVYTYEDYVGIFPWNLQTRQNGESLHVLAHEIGHAMGLDHLEYLPPPVMTRSANWGVIREVQHEEVVGVLNRNRSLTNSSAPAERCCLYIPRILQHHSGTRPR